MAAACFTTPLTPRRYRKSYCSNLTINPKKNLNVNEILRRFKKEVRSYWRAFLASSTRAFGATWKPISNGVHTWTSRFSEKITKRHCWLRGGTSEEKQLR